MSQEDATPPPPPAESEEPADPEAAEPPTEPPTEPGEAEEIPSEHEQVQDIPLEDPPHAQVYDIDNDDDDDDDDDYNDDDDFEDRYNEQQYNSHAPAHEGKPPSLKLLSRELQLLTCAPLPLLCAMLACHRAAALVETSCRLSRSSATTEGPMV